MNYDTIKQLLSTYIEGWKSGDREKILSTLDPSCVLIEADGEPFRGKEVISRMLDSRVLPGSTVDRWEGIYHSLSMYPFQASERIHQTRGRPL